MSKERLSYQDYRPLHKGEAGYSATRRQYVSPSNGDIISLARFQKGAHGEQTYNTRRFIKTVVRGEKIEKRNPRANEQYKRMLTSHVNKVNREREKTGEKPITRGEARQSQDFKDAYAALKREGRRKAKDNAPHGKLARALEDLGLREVDADYPVGETPD